jgi:hypothetical protein
MCIDSTKLARRNSIITAGCFKKRKISLQHEMKTSQIQKSRKTSLSWSKKQKLAWKNKKGYLRMNFVANRKLRSRGSLMANGSITAKSLLLKNTRISQ